MATRARVVIGANFGDEGKGLATDVFAAAAGPDCLVVRHNGGAQAGHTVALADGRRHVFSHVGSGTFSGATTYLSRFFVANPLLLGRELSDLAALGICPRLLADPACPVTTPYDMLINEMVEDARGHARHGSVGVGFGETLERAQSPQHALTVADLADRAALADRLDRIRRDWVPARLAALGFPGLEAARAGLILSDALLERWLADVVGFLAAVEVADAAVLRDAREVVFEGAQGLMLDQGRGWFPHVTRSNTGIRNACALAVEAGMRGLEVTYATRAYLTRHGAGPLPGELPEAPYAGVADTTNLPHRYQGMLRFAHLDLDLLAASVRADLSDAPGTLRVTHRLLVTCLDQVGTERARWTWRGEPVAGSAEDLAAAAGDAVGASQVLAGRGPTRHAVTLLDRSPAARAGEMVA